MKAYLTNYKQSPRKVRVVANLVRGRRVPEALAALRVLVKQAGSPLEKLIRSGVANAKNNSGVLPENLVIKELRVDKGVTLKRIMPRARGSAFPIKKRASNVMLVLEEKPKKIKRNKLAKSV